MVAVAIGGAALVGGVATVASGDAQADAIKSSADQSAAVQKYIYDQTRADYAPWRAAGESALKKLSSMYGVDGQPVDSSSILASDPGYSFRLGEGDKAIERAAAASGMRLSPATTKGLIRYNSDYASSEYDKIAGRLAQLAGLGQSATGSTAQAGQAYATNTGNAMMTAGAARGSAYANTGSAINGTVQNLANIYGYGQGAGWFPSGGGTYGGTPPIYGGNLGGIY